MNRIERVQTVMRGEIPDRIPVMPHNFLMAAREHGVMMEEYRSSSRVIAETFIDAWQRYETDGILVDVDTALLADACGAEVLFPRDIAAVTRDVQPRSIEAIIEDTQKVNLTDCERVKIYLEAVNRLSVFCNENDVFLRANADQGPFSLACLLVGMNEFLTMLLDEEAEDSLLALMRETLRISLDMHRLCYEAGGHCTSYGNSSEGCSVVSPAIFRKYAKPFDTALNTALREDGIMTICHICGWTDPILEDLRETGCAMYEFDSLTDIRKAREIGRGYYALSGNLSPAMLAEGSPEEVRRETKTLLELFRGQGGLMLGAGCALGPKTPPENISALLETVKSLG